jgi:integrase
VAYIYKKVHRSGNISYVVRIKDQNGIWREKSAGPRRKDAEILMARLLQEVAAGTFGQERIDPRFSEFYASWTEAKNKALKPSSLADYSNAFNRYILPRFGRLHLSQITPLVVQSWVNDLSSSGLSPASVRKVYRYFSSCLNQARKQGILETDPLRGIIHPRVQARELDFLTPGEIARMLDVCGPRERALFAVLAYAGLRLG